MNNVFNRLFSNSVQTSDTAPSGNNNSRTAIILLVLAYVLIYLLPLGVRPMATPDESRYGEVPREMLQSGDWAVPHLIGLRYFEKPPLGYWLNAISIKIFGENNFAVRLPSALAAGLSAFFIWLLLMRAGYGQRAALAAAVVFLSTAEILVVGTLAVLDNPFSLFLSAGMVLFYLAGNAAEATRRQRNYLLASGVLFGLAFLSKGFLAIALPGLVLLPYCLIQKRYKLLWLQSWWVVLSTVITVLPWAIIIHLREPDFWHYFIWVEHIRRFLSPNAQHAAPAYAYLMMLPGAMFPWLAFLPAAIAGFRHNKKHTDLFRYLLLWFALPLLFFSISKGKLATYILPCMVPAAILVAVGILNYFKAGRKRLIVLGAVINSLLLLGAMALLLYNQYSNNGESLYSATESFKLFSMTASLLVAVTLTITAGFFTTPRKMIITIAASVVTMFALLSITLPTSVLNGKSPNALFKQVEPKLKPGTIFVSDSNVVRAVAWVFKRTDIFLLTYGELGYGLSYPEHRDKMLGVKGLQNLLAQQQRGEVKHDIAVFCENPCFAHARSILGQGTQHYSTEMYSVWLKPYAAKK